MLTFTLHGLMGQWAKWPTFIAMRANRQRAKWQGAKWQGDKWQGAKWQWAKWQWAKWQRAKSQCAKWRQAKSQLAKWQRATTTAPLLSAICCMATLFSYCHSAFCEMQIRVIAFCIVHMQKASLR